MTKLAIAPWTMGLLVTACAFANAAQVTWPDAARASAVLQSFEAELDSHDSATAVLQAWCDVHAMAPGAKIAAHAIQGADKTPSEAARRALGLKSGVEVRYRRVDLACGEHVLSQADNWYLPAQLTPDMNRQLETSQTPFGVVVAPLRFHRQTLSVQMLFKQTPVMPHEVLQHSAVLTTPDGAPFSFVVETYTDQLLAFPPPP